MTNIHGKASNLFAYIRWGSYAILFLLAILATVKGLCIGTGFAPNAPELMTVQEQEYIVKVNTEAKQRKSSDKVDKHKEAKEKRKEERKKEKKSGKKKKEKKEKKPPKPPKPTKQEKKDARKHRIKTMAKKR